MDELRNQYQLNVSRIFDVRPPVLYRAFTDPGLLAGWLPPPGWMMPDDQQAIDATPGGQLSYTFVDEDDPARRLTTSAVFRDVAADGPVAWTEEGAVDPFTRHSQSLSVQLQQRPAGHTLLELREGPMTWDEEIAARERWNGAFSRLDTVLEHPEDAG
jgi:uncharacterized protein YndB with AHSA1/START domain